MNVNVFAYSSVLSLNVTKLQGMTRSTICEAIAFIIGGGCYGEYQNLQMLSNEKRSISYGSTEILNAETFLQQRSQLGD